VSYECLSGACADCSSTCVWRLRTCTPVCFVATVNLHPGAPGFELPIRKPCPKPHGHPAMAGLLTVMKHGTSGSVAWKKRAGSSRQHLGRSFSLTILAHATSQPSRSTQILHQKHAFRAAPQAAATTHLWLQLVMLLLLMPICILVALLHLSALCGQLHLLLSLQLLQAGTDLRVCSVCVCACVCACVCVCVCVRVCACMYVCMHDALMYF